MRQIKNENDVYLTIQIEVFKLLAQCQTQH